MALVSMHIVDSSLLIPSALCRPTPFAHPVKFDLVEI